MLVWPKESQGLFSTRVWLGNVELSFVKEFHYVAHIMTADCRDDKDIKKQFTRQNVVGNMLVRKFSFSPIEAKIQLFKWYCYPIYGCALWCIHSRTLLENLLSVIVTHSNVFINVPRYTSSSLAFAMNATDHFNVVLCKFAYSLMIRVVASHNSIVTAIVNTD